MIPLTVPEARSILAADEALEASFLDRLASGSTLGIEEREAWIRLVESAAERIATYEGSRLSTIRAGSK